MGKNKVRYLKLLAPKALNIVVNKSMAGLLALPNW